MKRYWRILAAFWLLSPSSLMAQINDLTGPRGLNWATNYGTCCTATIINDVVKLDDVIVVAFSIDTQNPNPPARIGLQISKDAGNTWQSVNALGTTATTTTVSFQQLALAGRRIYAQTTSKEIYYSDDKGQKWLPVDPESKLFKSSDNPVAGIYADENYLYAHFYSLTIPCVGCGLERQDKIYRIPNSLNESSVFNVMLNNIQLKLTPTGTGNWFITDSSDGKVYEYNANFQRIRTVLAPGSIVYDIKANGDYVAIMSNVLYESYDGGYSFIKENDDYFTSCQLTNGATIIGDELFMSTGCGAVRKKTSPGATLYNIEPIGFHYRFSRGMFYDLEKKHLYFTSGLLHRFDLVTQQGTTFHPLPGNAHINDLFEYNGDIYAGTADNGIWRYKNNRWQQFSAGLSIQNNDRIPIAYHGIPIFKLDTLNFPSLGKTLCAGTNFGLYCLNIETEQWHDVSSHIFATLYGSDSQDQFISGGSAILAFKQLSQEKVLLGYNQYYSNGAELVGSLLTMEEQLKKPLSSHITIPAKFKNVFSYYSPMHKTSFDLIAGKILKAEGSYKQKGGFNHSQQETIQPGLHQFIISPEVSLGIYPRHSDSTRIDAGFQTNDVQSIVKFSNGYAAAVRGEGVYFSGSVEGSWMLRNKLLPNVQVNSLAVFNSILYLGTDSGIYQWVPDKSHWELVDGTATDNITVLRPYSGGLLVGTVQGVKTLQLKSSGRKRNKLLKYILLGSM